MLDLTTRMLGAFAAAFSPAVEPAARGRVEVRWLFLLVLAAALVRFYGLGDVGLHPPDEDTLSLPATHLAEHGEPLYPSGMYYARALAHTYLVAGSIKAFGNSEWALRFPSAVCGVLVVFLAYFVGRRFLNGSWNLAFVAAVAFLPELVLQSQTARMYIFLVACVAAYLVFILAWDQRDRWIFPLGALVMMLLGLHFHPLMVFTAPLFLFPGLRQADLRKLMTGFAACVVSVWAMGLLGEMTARFFIRGDVVEMARLLGLPFPAAEVTPRPQSSFPWPLLGAGVFIAIACAFFLARQVEGRLGKVTAGTLTLLGLAAQLLLNYHIAAVLLLAAAIIALRSGLRSFAPLWIVAGSSLFLAVLHVTWLIWLDVGTRGVILMTMMGEASIWSFINYVPVSYAAVALAGAGAAVALWRVARGGSVPDVWLFALLGVWAPLFLIGWHDVYPQFRYMTTALIPLLITAFASCQWLLSTARGAWIAGLAALACVAVVNPWSLAKAVNPGYDLYPDHVGAAEFVRSLQPGPEDVLIAEDAIMQTYYLGRVDYLLTDPENALRFSYVADGEVREIYSDAEVIATAERLDAVLRTQRSGNVYVIGSGENFVNGRRWQRSAAMEAILEQLEVVYEGRDGRTRVWKVPVPWNG